MQLAPYLTLYGNCEAALAHYKSVLGGDFSVMSFSDSPENDSLPEGWRGKVMHATFTFPGGSLMASDGRPDSQQPGDSNISLSLGLSDATEGERVFNALSAGGVVDVPFAKQFWGATFGAFTDRYGIYWMINCG